MVSTIILGTLLAGAGPARAESSYELLKRKADAIAREDRGTGWSYVISGGVALGVSIPAYYLSTDLFARVIYSVGETLGVAAVGYGSYLILIDNDYRRFEKILGSVPELSAEERDRLAQGFLDLNAERARNTRKIRVISHGLTAALNFLNAFTASQPELKQSLFFIGGVNTLAAVSFAIRKSEEETLSGSRTTAELSVGPGLLALSIHF